MVHTKQTPILVIVLSIVFASLLGFYALDIASAFPQDLYMLVLISTISISIILFIVAIIKQFKLIISGKIKSSISRMILTVMLLMTVVVSLYISWWSLFLVAMYWG